MTHSIQIKLIASTFQQFDIICQRLILYLGQTFLELIRAELQMRCRNFMAGIHTFKSNNFIVHAVINAAEFLTGTDRPVYRIGTNAELVLDLLQQFIRITCFTVHLIDEGKNRDIAHNTDLKQLASLRLDTL